MLAHTAHGHGSHSTVPVVLPADRYATHSPCILQSVSGESPEWRQPGRRGRVRLPWHFQKTARSSLPRRPTWLPKDTDVRARFSSAVTSLSAVRSAYLCGVKL